MGCRNSYSACLYGINTECGGNITRNVITIGRIEGNNTVINRANYTILGKLIEYVTY